MDVQETAYDAQVKLVETNSFRARLKQTTEEMILFGVRWLVVTALFGAALAYAMQDYTQVRQGALQGKAAFEFLQQQVAAQQKAAQPQKVAP